MEIRASHLKRIILALTVLAAVSAAALSLTVFSHSTPPLGDVSQELHGIVSKFVQKDHSVRNCVLSVMTGDGFFVWSGAAGIAHQTGQIPMTAETPIYIASITKLYTATAVMLLVEKGALSLDDPMAKYLPNQLIQGIHVYYGKDYSTGITIRQLLSHSSGIADYYTQKSLDGKSLFELFVEEPGRSWTVDQTIARARNDLKPTFPPGTDVFYSDTNFQLLGKVIEVASGKPLHVIYDDYFFRPLGLEHTWLAGYRNSTVDHSLSPADVFYAERNITRTRANGAYWADGGIISTAREMNIFLKALNQGKIITPASLRLMHHWRKLHFPLQYGYGTMYFCLPGPVRALTRIPPMWGHSGSTGSFLYYYDALDLYLAGSIDQTESKIAPFVLMAEVIQAIAVMRSQGKLESR